MSTVEEDLVEAGADTRRAPGMNGVVIGALIGFTDEGQTPLVLYPGQPSTHAICAASTLDLHGTHIGRQVVLMFENCDPQRPIIVGLLRTARTRAPIEQPGSVEVDADGERLLVTAKNQLVLRCGKASITLTKAGKVLIEGAYVSNRSSGVVRIKGGSVQIN
jgi:Domain of unknown function (DUF6484)